MVHHVHHRGVTPATPLMALVTMPALCRCLLPNSSCLACSVTPIVRTPQSSWSAMLRVAIAMSDSPFGQKYQGFTRRFIVNFYHFRISLFWATNHFCFVLCLFISSFAVIFKELPLVNKMAQVELSLRCRVLDNWHVKRNNERVK